MIKSEIAQQLGHRQAGLPVKHHYAEGDFSFSFEMSHSSFIFISWLHSGIKVFIYNITKRFLLLNPHLIFSILYRTFHYLANSLLKSAFTTFFCSSRPPGFPGRNITCEVTCSPSGRSGMRTSGVLSYVTPTLGQNSRKYM